MTMAIYTIVRVYQVPADNRLQATDRMLEALTLGVADDLHVKDVLREPDGKPGSGTQIPQAAQGLGDAAVGPAARPVRDHQALSACSFSRHELGGRCKSSTRENPSVARLGCLDGQGVERERV